MKAGIHPDYKKVVFMDTNTGFKFLSGSTKGSNETVEISERTLASQSWMSSLQRLKSSVISLSRMKQKALQG